MNMEEETQLNLTKQILRQYEGSEKRFNDNLDNASLDSLEQLKLMVQVSQGENQVFSTELSPNNNQYPKRMLKQNYNQNQNLIVQQKGVFLCQSTRQSFQLLKVRQLIKINPYIQVKDIVGELTKIEKQIGITYNQSQHSQINSVTKILQNSKIKLVPINLISSPRNQFQDIQNRKDYAQKLLNIIYNNKSFFYFDEMVIHRGMRESKVWSQGGYPIANATYNLRSTNMLIVAVMNNRGNVQFDFIHGKADPSSYSILFNSLLSNSIIPRKQLGNPELKNWTMIISGAVHEIYRQTIEKVAVSKGMEVLTVPFFSGFLNPLETWFDEIRKRVIGWAEGEEMIKVVSDVIKDQVKDYLVGFEDRVMQPLLSMKNQ